MKKDYLDVEICESVVCCSYIVTNTVIVQCEHFLLVSVELDHRSALILVPLENTSDLSGTNVNTVISDSTKGGHASLRKDDPLLTCPLCSPSTTITESYSLFGTIVSSMSCFTSAAKKETAGYSRLFVTDTRY